MRRLNANVTMDATSQNHYLMCKENKFKLKRYDYNEPCKGKYQCDRESATAKSILNNYVNTGNDVLKAEDVYHALHYGQGMKNPKVTVIEINNRKTELSREKMKTKFSQIHSVEFKENEMRMWRYFGIGEGISEEYKNVVFKPGLDTVLPFSSTERNKKHNIDNDNKKRTDRQVCTKMFCPEPGCTAIFSDEINFEKHIQEGYHTEVNAPKCSAMDHIRKTFASELKISHQRIILQESLEKLR